MVMAGEPNDGVLCVKPGSRQFKPITNIASVARRVELGELIDERFEFASNTHHTVKISPSAHWFRRVPRFQASQTRVIYRNPMVGAQPALRR